MKKSSSNFNKLFATTAIATAALVVPMDAFAAEVSSVKILGNNIVGAVLTADTLLIPESEILSYQWFHDEGLDGNDVPKHIPIPTNATAKNYTIDSGDVGKALIVKVTMNDGITVHTSEKIVVDKTIKIINKETGNEPKLDDTFVNSTIYADIKNLGETFKSYQWYYLENDKKTPIAGATKYELIIPVEAAGKDLIVEVKTESGQTYTSAPTKVEVLKLMMTDKPIVTGFSLDEIEISSNMFALPGDKLTVTNPVVKDDVRELKANQIAYSYQWMYEVDGSYSYIEGATAATYTIPKDAIDKEMKNIVVRVTAKVGTAKPISGHSLNVTVADTPADSLDKAIETELLKKDANGAVIYKALDFGKFEGLIIKWNSHYAGLTAAAKAKVTKYDILKRATEDHALITALKDKVDKANALPDDPAKLQNFRALWAEYEQLDLLQRSLDFESKMFKAIQNGLGNTSSTFEIKEVIAINEAILDLLEDLTTNGTGLQYGLVQYKEKEIAKLQEEITKIENRIAKLPNDYQMMVQNQGILTTAKSDIKKVQAFIKKFDKLDLKAVPKKQISTAKSIRSAYNKLTIKQMSLVPSTKLADLKQAEDTTQEENRVQPFINKLFLEEKDAMGNLTYKTYVVQTAESWSGYSKDVNTAISEYKSLTKQAASKVKGYQQTLTLQKDLKVAEKVVKQIETYLLLNPAGTQFSKLKSSHKSMVQAYNKLTTLQQSLVYNKDLIGESPVENPPGTGTPPDPGTPPDNETAEDKAKAQVIIDEIIDVLKKSTSTEINEYALKIDSVIMNYKQLPSKARKYVTNYDALMTMQKDVKAVLSFIKKANDADAELNTSKKYTKIQSAKTAYAKLSAKQQELAAKRYSELMKQLDDPKEFENLVTFNGNLYSLVVGDLYVKSIVDIKEYEIIYKELSSAEKKQITNYPILKQAISDMKKVESFLKKYQTEKTQASALKSFASLTAKQTSLIPNDIREDISKELKEQQDTNENALKLIGDIDGLLQNGVYTNPAGLKDEVKGLRKNYEDLPSASEKSLVKNYSKLEQAERDSQKVDDVKSLFDTDKETWQKEYNRLSKRLELLYNELYPFSTP
ncbi:MAG: hypothetical protein RR642_01110 [Solibacillus sp.]